MKTTKTIISTAIVVPSWFVQHYPAPVASSFPQIGNSFALTAAHCLYDDDNEEVLPASSFSIMLGLHDRRKATEPNRWR